MFTFSCRQARFAMGIAAAMMVLFTAAPAFAAKIQIKDGPDLDIWGQLQVHAQSLDRQGEDSHRDDLEFGSDRVRFGTRIKWGKWSGAFQFNAADTKGDRLEGTLGDGSFIRDAKIGYSFNDHLKLAVGQGKTPLGMGINGSGSRLPLMRRTMTSRLAIERALGMTLSGRNIGGNEEKGRFGFDLGLYNPAGRSKAYEDTSNNDVGDDLTYVGRLMYDYGRTFHVEAAYGVIEDAGGFELDKQGNVVFPADRKDDDDYFPADSEDYKVFDVAAQYKNGPVKLRAEYIDGRDVQGLDGFDEQAWYLEGRYKFTEVVEGAVRYQEAECDDCKGMPDDDRELKRFELGLNLFFGQNVRNGRVQLYYANVGDDEEDYNGRAGGGNNNLDVVGAQLQMMF